jgi:hypothetical protein
MKFLPARQNTKDLEKQSNVANIWRLPSLNEINSEGLLWGYLATETWEIGGTNRPARSTQPIPRIDTPK